MKASEIFEGEDSSLKKTFDEATPNTELDKYSTGKTIDPRTRKLMYEQGLYKYGECPDCGDYLFVSNDGKLVCIYCDFVSAFNDEPITNNKE